MAEERLQKILPRAGIASRRAAERLMVENRVVVNGKPATRLGMRADAERDHIRVDGKLLRLRDGPKSYFVAFKPQRMLTTLSDPSDRPTVKDLLAANRIRARVYPVGRLDWDADGLLLLTDDGDLASRVMAPRTHLEKVYRVKIKGCPDERALSRLRRGVVLEGPRRARTLPAEVAIERIGDGTTWVRLTLVEGRQNQIKKMFVGIGHPVRRLRRIAVGPLRLGRLRIGQVRALKQDEIEKLKRAVGLASTSRRAPRRRRRAASAT